MKKFATMLGVIGSCVGAAFADAQAVIDTAALNTVITQLGTDLEGWVAALIPILAGVAGSFLVIWLLKLAIRIVKGFGSAK